MTHSYVWHDMTKQVDKDADVDDLRAMLSGLSK